MIHLPLRNQENPVMTRLPHNIDPIMIAARGPVRAEDISEPSRFAWEVLRRKQDYRAARARSILVRKGDASVELIEAPEADSRWGLCFR